MEALLEARSLLDLRSMLALSAREILTMTHLSGKINGFFTGSGVGCMDYTVGCSAGEIELFNYPSSFAVPLCASWKCKHCRPQSFLVCTEEATIEYSKGARGTIHTVGEVRSLRIGASLCFNRFDGDCEGPTGVEKVLPWRVADTRIRAGAYDMIRVRQLSVEGRVVEANWNGKMVVADGEDLGAHTIACTQEDFS